MVSYADVVAWFKKVRKLTWLLGLGRGLTIGFDEQAGYDNYIISGDSSWVAVSKEAIIKIGRINYQAIPLLTNKFNNWYSGIFVSSSQLKQIGLDIIKKMGYEVINFKQKYYNVSNYFLKSSAKNTMITTSDLNVFVNHILSQQINEKASQDYSKKKEVQKKIQDQQRIQNMNKLLEEALQEAKEYVVQQSPQVSPEKVEEELRRAFQEGRVELVNEGGKFRIKRISS